MELYISNPVRMGLALWLQVNWSGNEEQIMRLLDAYDTFCLADFVALLAQNEQGQIVFVGPEAKVKDALNESVTNTYIVSPELGVFLLSNFPQAQTPARLGPAKARFLRDLRKTLVATIVQVVPAQITEPVTE